MTTIEVPSAIRQRVPVLVAGLVDCEDELREALDRQQEVEVVGRQYHVTGADDGLAGAAPAVVLLGVPGEYGDSFARFSLQMDVEALRKHTEAPIVLLVSSASPELLEDALELGVTDVLVLPRMLDTVAFAVRKASQGAGRPAAPESNGERERRGQMVIVFSPKGGTGKTVLSTNLAATAARNGRSVLLVDLDLQFGDAGMMLGLTPSKTIHDLVTAPGELDAEKLAGYTTEHSSGLHLLAAPPTPEDADTVTEAKVAEILGVARTAYDVVVLDTSPFFYGPLLGTLGDIDRLLLVCGLDAPTMKNVRLGLRTLQLLSFPSTRLDLVLNRISPNGDVTKEQVEGVVGRPVRFEVPQDPAVLKAVNRGEPAALLDPDGAFATAIRGIEAAVMPAAGGPASPADSKRRFLRRAR